MNPKIEELVRKIRLEKSTIKRLSLLEELSVHVNTYTKEEEQKLKRERRI